MDEKLLPFWLTLCMTPRVGIKKISHLLIRYELSELKTFNYHDWIQCGFQSNQAQFLTKRYTQSVLDCLEWREQTTVNNIVTYLDNNYPPLLKEIASPPPILFIKGNVDVILKPQMAIVGSRNASRYGQQSAFSFARSLAEKQLVITSGLALGIDGYAHDGALQAHGMTIAVLGSGLDHIYPSCHKKLALRIQEQGAIISEFAPTVKPRAEYFPRRNRIISGLSLGVLIVEAAEKSGSLITAKYALEQNREIFVIPGSINIPNSKGSNELIRTGACLVQETQQIIDEIKHLVTWRHNPDKIEETVCLPAINIQEELPFAQLLANVGEDATPVDIIASRTHIPVHEVTVQLLELELRGLVVAVSGGYIRNGRG